MTMAHTSGNSSIDSSIIRDIYCGPEVLFETCVTMKFVDDDNDDDLLHSADDNKNLYSPYIVHLAALTMKTKKY